jgi:GDPmannose 4,6-dehydratase
MKKALITGITGQDGSYLSELLLSRGYEVYGIIRRSSNFNTQRIEHLYQGPHAVVSKLKLMYGDMNDASSLNKVIKSVRPDEIYNLAAQSHVRVSFDMPEYTGEVTGLGAVRLLEAIREAGSRVKFYNASSSELFGNVVETPQRETTSFNPRSPYAAAKAYAYYITKNYREAYGIFAVNGILFNHESPRRGETFVTRKITRALARMKFGLQNELFIGNLDAKRDWGFAGDYVEAMWMMMQHPEPDDYVVATGEAHSVREFVESCFAHAGMEIAWQGSGVDEIGVDRATGRKIVGIDPRYFRPTEVDLLLGDSGKVRKVLGWKPRVFFHDLVKMMVDSDLEQIRKQVEGSRDGGHGGEMH